MHRLSKEERLGAAALVCVAVLLTAGAFLLRSCGPRHTEPPPHVTVMFDEKECSDSSGEAVGNVPRHVKKGRKGSRRSKGSHRKKVRGPAARDAAGEGAGSYRDFLADTVPPLRGREERIR